MRFTKELFKPILIIFISFIYSCGVIHSSSSDIKLTLKKVERSKDKNLYFFSVKNRGPDFEIQGIEIYNDSGLDLIDYLPENFHPPDLRIIQSKTSLKFSFALDHNISEFKLKLRSNTKRFIELNYTHVKK